MALAGIMLWQAVAPGQAAPPAGTLGANAPAGAVVLFDGKDVSAWRTAWKVEDGAMVAGGGNTISRQEFGDALLHVEFRTPSMPDKTGQARGNSGVYLQGRYEIQVLDSYGVAEPGTGDCGAVYNQSAPLVNACRPPRVWQTYDIVFRAPRFDPAGKLTARPRVTVFQNGVVVQNNTEIAGPTTGAMAQEVPPTGPLMLQDHGNAVAFRNVWVLPLKPSGAAHY